MADRQSLLKTVDHWVDDELHEGRGRVIHDIMACGVPYEDGVCGSVVTGGTVTSIT